MTIADLIPVSCRALRKEVADAECESYDLRKIIRPCVYTFIKKGVSLYIGSSANGMLRFGSPDHHQADIRASADEIVVLWFENVEQAQDIEKRLVRAIEPPYNGTCRPLLRPDQMFAAAQELKALIGRARAA